MKAVVVFPGKANSAHLAELQTRDAIKVFYEVLPGWEKDARHMQDGQ